MNSATAKKITLATVKAFVRKTVGKGLHVKATSRFNGMTDGVDPVKDNYRAVESALMSDEYSLGIDGAYFVRDSRDYFRPINNAEWTGVQVYNSCGTFELVVPANSQLGSKLRVDWSL